MTFRTLNEEKDEVRLNFCCICHLCIVRHRSKYHFMGRCAQHMGCSRGKSGCSVPIFQKTKPHSDIQNGMYPRPGGIACHFPRFKKLIFVSFQSSAGPEPDYTGHHAHRLSNHVQHTNDFGRWHRYSYGFSEHFIAERLRNQFNRSVLYLNHPFTVDWSL